MKRMFIIHALMLSFVTLMSVSIDTLAQGTSGSGPVSAVLEEIVVTARRREERLQDTPVAITVLTASAIEDRGISNLAEIGVLAPNVSISNTAAFSGSTSTAVIFMRGFGQTDFTLTTEPGVGVYIDGVYSGRSLGALLDLGDLERVEVLRGPQGTLFGKNAIGGALNVITKRPDMEHLSGQADITGGTFNRIDARATLNLPLSSKAALRLSGGSLNRAGYAERVYAGDELGGRDTLVGRASLLWTPTSDLDVLVVADATRTRGDSIATTLTGLTDGQFIAPGATAPLPQAGGLAALESTLPPGTPPLTFTNFATNDPYKSGGIGPNFSDDDIWGVATTIEWRFAENLSIKSISAYREADSRFGRDAYNLPFQFTAATTDAYSHEQFTQEIQLQGLSFDGRLNWITGIFYLQEDGENLNRVSLNRVLLPPFTGVPPTSPTATLISGGKIDNISVAGFAQGTFEVTDQVSLTAGLRYSYEQKEFDTRGFQFIEESGLPVAPQLVLDDSYDDWSPRVSVEYRWTDDFMVYASFATGFKGGGFVQRVFPGSLLDFLNPSDPFEILPYGPETAGVYEIGLKFELFDRRLRVNAAAFLTDYNDVQLVTVDGFTPQTVNGGEVEIKGAELEFEALIADQLLISGTIGYLDAAFVKVTPNADGITLDTELPYTSKWTLALSAAYTIPITAVSGLTFRADWSYRTAYFTQAVNEPITRQDGYDALDLGAIYNIDERWSIQAGGKNVLSEEYLLGASSALNNPLGFAEGNFAPPAQWYITLRKVF
ncbi:MAG: TonB-dependent receptor [Gammaproteobacteria bacterium]|nr:TonB-dependent receptor [Gammaproteobacteria bacterium]